MCRIRSADSRISMFFKSTCRSHRKFAAFFVFIGKNWSACWSSSLVSNCQWTISWTRSWTRSCTRSGNVNGMSVSAGDRTGIRAESERRRGSALPRTATGSGTQSVRVVSLSAGTLSAHRSCQSSNTYFSGWQQIWHWLKFDFILWTHRWRSFRDRCECIETCYYILSIEQNTIL